MRYYIFKVRDNIDQTYYILNNRYIGYVGFDSDTMRGIMEHHAKIKREYQPFAEGVVFKDAELHALFCKNARLSLAEAEKLIKKYPFEKTPSKLWFKIYYPNKNSSESYLRCVEQKGNKTIIHEIKDL